MEARRSLLASFVLAALAAHVLVSVVVVEARTAPLEKATQGDDVKKPDCVPGMDPRSFPGTGGGHGGITPVTPSHGGSTGTTPSHGGGIGYVPTPSHGGGTGTLPSPSHGGSSPTSPSTGGGGAYGGSPPSTPSTGGGGAYGGSPSTPVGGGSAYGGGPPSPARGGGAYGGSSPSTPAHGGGIGTSSPTPFVSIDPHSISSLPGSCDYWRSHPMEIWSAISGRFPSTSSSSSMGPTMGHFFGGGAAGSGLGGLGGGAGGGVMSMSIEDALGNTRSDGTGALLREGAAALLNSMTRAGFPYTTYQVRDAFARAAAAAGGGNDDGAAAAQAAAFRKANEGGKA